MEQAEGRLIMAGLPAFLEKQLVIRFNQGGWTVSSINDRLKTEKTENLLAAKRADVLIYMLDPRREYTVGWLDRIMIFAYNSSVRRVLLLSNADVFGNGKIAQEDSAREPQTKSGRRLSRLEALAGSWRSYEKLQVTVMHIPELYGEGVKMGEGLLGRLVQAAIDKTGVAVADVGIQPFLSAENAAEGIWLWAVSGNNDPVINLGPGTKLLWRDFVELTAPIMPQNSNFPLTRRREDGTSDTSVESIRYGTSALDGAYAKNQLGWTADTDDRAGIKAAVKSMVDEQQKQWEMSRSFFTRERGKRILKRLIPYAENIAGAVIMAVIAALQGSDAVHAYFDLNFIYIGAMGLLYGKYHGFLAAAFSMLILSFGYVSDGSDPIGLLYEPGMMLHYVAYLVAGGVTGYFSDRNEYERQSSEWHQKRAVNQIALLQRMLSDSLQVRDRLYRQIVNSGDSVGRIYRTVQKLDSVEMEQIYTQAVMVTADILGVTDVAIYVAGSRSREYYLRRKVFCGERAAARPRSLRIEDYGYLKDVLATKRTFMNRKFAENAPDLAAPAVYGGKVIAVIEVYGLTFEQWSYNEQNLLSLTARLISSALSRAAEWERSRAEENYLPGTRILNREAFAKVIEELRVRHALVKATSNQLLVLEPNAFSLSDLNDMLKTRVREQDFIGEYGDGYALILTDSSKEAPELVKKRLADMGLYVASQQEVM